MGNDHFSHALERRSKGEREKKPKKQKQKKRGGLWWHSTVLFSRKRHRHSVEMGLFDKLPVWDSRISCVVGGAVFSPAGRCRWAAAAGLLLARSRRLVRQSRLCRVLVTGVAAPSTFSRTQLCGTSHQVGSKWLVSAMDDGVLFTAPHARGDPISLPTARRSPPSKLVSCHTLHRGQRHLVNLCIVAGQQELRMTRDGNVLSSRGRHG
ncbi:hypothetical protein LY76DRAFT_62346 [Colletotrichum caudatum]|nr:hypothetical protein LY76DRAFT_62346 [Colletotrichum caudatum]